MAEATFIQEGVGRVQSALKSLDREGRERIEVIDPPTRPESYFPLDPEAEHWNVFWNQISAIHRLAAENDIPVVLIIFPLEFQVLDENFPTLPQQVVTERAAEAGIPALDLLPAFQQACLEKPGGPCQLEDRYLFADVWMHPSAYGHEVTAAELETFLTGTVELTKNNNLALEEN